ncbi:hypothetical protein FRC07_002470 [Ceratobasidium sp. 392]|nr:hypothetical protein FRC07_002470 [Ceratobasidium sp. 392]
MFNLHRMLVPDLLHEVELGVWKSLFAHLIRMLHTCGPHAVAIFDSRFREIISYPPDTIRKFRHSVSGMKKLAGRDYEDILQCCGPCFEGLFPDEDDAAIQQLIFTMAHWHALAKLRVHTATTLTLLRNQTATLGRRLRRFQSAVAARYNTVETDNEHEKRKRQETRRALATGSVLHSHGDYADAIELYGTADSYSTQIGELEHRRAKSHARRASQAQLVEGVNKVDRRQNYLNQCAEKLAKFEDQELVEQEAQRAEPETESAEPGSSQESTQYESLDAGGISEHHHVGIRGVTVQLGSFLRQNANDRALLNFIPSLKDHLLLRFGVSPAENLLFTELQRQQVVIPSGTLTKHATLRVSYTTYDVRRNQDTINPRTKHHFVMVQSRDNDPDHPFWYAKVLGIYHANVVHLALQSQIPRRIDFLWVRWLELTHIGSWDLCQLDRVAYATPNSTIDEFGFIDPTTVVRSSHLIPAFCYNRATDPVLPSLAYDSPLSGDWNSYYVNRFVDRDMSIRYMPGIGIGHLSSMQHPRESAIEPMDVDEPELEIGPAREEMATTSGSDAEHDGSDNSSVASVDEFCEEDEDY